MWLKIILYAIAIIIIWFLILKVFYHYQLKNKRRKYDPEKNLSRREPEPSDFRTRDGNQKVVFGTDSDADSAEQCVQGTGELGEGELFQTSTPELTEPDSREPVEDNGSSQEPKPHRRFFRRKKVEYEEQKSE